MTTILFLNLDRLPSAALQALGNVLRVYHAEFVGILRGGTLEVVLSSELINQFLTTVGRDVWPIELENAA